jgi:hypothetical protein
MLYRITSLIDDVRFQRLVAVQYSLFEFLCHPDNPLVDLNQADLEKLIEQCCIDSATARWINNGIVFRQDILAPIVAYLKLHPDQRAKLLAAFKHDFEYYTHLNDGEFTFMFFSLDEDLKTLIHKLMVTLYEKLDGDGYPQYAMLDGKSFNRHQMLIRWKSANSHLAVCPACDGEPPSEIDDVPLSDTDHFLPKAFYPFFALHPINLVPVCTECNRWIKRDQDPLVRNNKRSFQHTFNPYAEAAIDVITVRCERKLEMGNKLVVTIFTEDDSLSAKVESLNQIFLLTKRWNSKIEQKIRTYIDTFLNAKKRFIQSSLEQEVREYFEEEFSDIVLGSDAFLILRKSYIQFVLTDQGEFYDLIER